MERAAGGQLVDEEVLTQIPNEFPFALPKGVELSTSVDLSPWFPPAGDQFKQASCSGWALGYGLTTYQMNRAGGTTMDGQGVVPSDSVFSPSYLYDQLVVLQDSKDCGIGAALYDAILLACNSGCCTLNMFPYDSAARDCLRPIPDSAKVQAAWNRMGRPLSLDTRDVTQWKYHLSQGEPIVFTASIDSTFDQGALTRGEAPFTWDMPAPKDWNGRVHHIMVCTGYDDADSCFVVLNSWGLRWGLNGYLRIPYNTMDWTCSEAYVTDRLTASPVLVKDDDPDLKKPNSRGRIKGRLDGSEVHRTDDLAWRSVSRKHDNTGIEVEFLDPTGKGAIRAMDAREDQPVTMFHEGTYYTFTFTGTSFLRGSPRYRLMLNDPRQEEFRQAVKERIRVQRNEAGKK